MATKKAHKKARVRYSSLGAPLADLGVDVSTAASGSIFLIMAAGLGIAALLGKKSNDAAAGDSGDGSSGNDTYGGDMLTPASLRQAMPKITDAATFAPMLNSAIAQLGLNKTGAAHFLAQIAAETGDLRYLEEIWLIDRPDETLNEAQIAIKKAQGTYQTLPRLGNSQPGDDYNFRGRGALQITGRGAYTRRGIVNNPSIAATPQGAIDTAVWYWQQGTPEIASAGGLTQFANAGDFDRVTRGVNAGNPYSTATVLYGIKERQAALTLAQQALA